MSRICNLSVAKKKQETTLLMEVKIKEKAVRFRTYDQNVVIEIPVLAEQAIKENALVQVVNEIVDRLEMSKLDSYYSKMGSPAYHPKMMIKVWIYGYCSGVYTSRKVAQKLREDLGFIWLSGNQQPCFKTLSSFRSVRMEEMIEEVFISVLSYLVVKGYIDLGDLYVDGSNGTLSRSGTRSG